MSQELFIAGQFKPLKRSKVYWVFHDSLVLIIRSLKHIIKNRDQVLGLTIQPLMFMLLFRYVFGGAINVGEISYVNFLMAGILVQTLAFGSLTTSMSLATDLQRGLIDRLKSLPIFSAGVVLGHVVGDLFRNIIQAAIMLSVGLLVGFRPVASFTDWLIIIFIILLFSFAVSWIAAIMGLVARSMEAVQWMGFLVVFPFTFASAAFAPTESMAVGLRVFAQNQPVTHVIESIRALMNGQDPGNHITLAIVWCLAIIFVAAPYATYLFKKYSGK
jgi:ABC transporter DrrB family efflux protein